MKFTKEVISALQILKDSAENDFERHRIAVLEQDLTKPPQPEIIDDSRQKFNGVTYAQNKKDKHYHNSTDIHRAVYTYYFGEIPEGYIIHHKDSNPENNSIENLQMLTVAEHRRVHNYNAVRKTGICKYCGKTFEFRNVGVYNAAFCSEPCRKKYKRERSPFEIRICEVCGKEFRTRKITERTTCSEECRRKKHSKNYNPEKTTAICQRCGKVFETLKNKPSAFCSAHCRSLNNYSRTMEERVCIVCGKSFICSKYSKTQVCCRQHAAKLRFENHVPVSQTSERICVVCGKTFTCHKSKPTKTCSPHCAMRLNWQTRRNQENKDFNASTENSSTNEISSAGIAGVSIT